MRGSIGDVSWRCGARGRWCDSVVDAIVEGHGLTLTRRQGERYCDFELGGLLEPALRGVSWKRAPEASDGEDATPAALMRRAIESRRAVISAEDDLRHAAWILEQARDVGSDSLQADALRLKSRRRMGRERRRAAKHRADAFAWEALAHLSRYGARRADDARCLRAALEAYVWSRTWGELAESSEPHPSDAAAVWRSTHEEVSAELARLFVPPEEEPAKHRPREGRTSGPGGSLRRRVRGSRRLGSSGASPNREASEGEPDPAHTAVESERRHVPPSASWREPSSPRRELPGRRPTPAWTVGVVARMVAGMSGGPRLPSSNAWCAICNSEYELPENTPILQTLCGCCSQKLIPHPSERRRIAKTCHIPGRCPHCAKHVIRRSPHRHLRCPGCGTAVSPIEEELP